MHRRSTFVPNRLAVAVGLSVLLAPSVTLAQTVDEILAKHIESRGGRDALKAVESARVTGTYYSEGGPSPIKIEYKRPDKIRLEYNYQGSPLVQAYDGRVGWAFAGSVAPRPRPLSGITLKQLRNRADLIDGVLVDSEDKGHAVELVGREDVGGSAAYKLKVTRKGGDVLHIYLDAESYLELKQESQTEVGGNPSNVTIAFADYRKVGDILRPYSIKTTIDTIELARTVFSQELVVDAIELNVGIDDSQFSMPEVEKKKASAGR